MIDPKLFTVERLLEMFFDDQFGNRDKWRRFAEIVPDYMPPFPDADTKPACVVRYRYRTADGTQNDAMLRHSSGPRQGHFWDIYGDDYRKPELALLALLQAPVPPMLLKSSEWRRWAELDGK